MAGKASLGCEEIDTCPLDLPELMLTFTELASLYEVIPLQNLYRMLRLYLLSLTYRLLMVQVQFVRTGGMYTKMRRENPEKPDPLPDLQRELMASLKTSDEYTPLKLQCDIFMILCKDPKPL